jgi:hypothetical protein
MCGAQRPTYHRCQASVDDVPPTDLDLDVHAVAERQVILHIFLYAYQAWWCHGTMHHVGVGAQVVPAQRWDVEQYYAPDASRNLTMNVRLAAFVTGFDKFDAAAFRCSSDADGLAFWHDMKKASPHTLLCVCCACMGAPRTAYDMGIMGMWQWKLLPAAQTVGGGGAGHGPPEPRAAGAGGPGAG